MWGDPGQRGNAQNYCGNNPVNRVDPLGLDEDSPSDREYPKGEASKHGRYRDRQDGGLKSEERGRKWGRTTPISSKTKEGKEILKQLKDLEKSAAKAGQNLPERFKRAIDDIRKRIEEGSGLYLSDSMTRDEGGIHDGKLDEIFLNPEFGDKKGINPQMVLMTWVRSLLWIVIHEGVHAVQHDERRENGAHQGSTLRDLEADARAEILNAFNLLYGWMTQRGLKVRRYWCQISPDEWKIAEDWSKDGGDLDELRSRIKKWLGAEFGERYPDDRPQKGFR